MAGLASLLAACSWLFPFDEAGGGGDRDAGFDAGRDAPRDAALDGQDAAAPVDAGDAGAHCSAVFRVDGSPGPLALDEDGLLLASRRGDEIWVTELQADCLTFVRETSERRLPAAINLTGLSLNGGRIWVAGNQPDGAFWTALGRSALEFVDGGSFSLIAGRLEVRAILAVPDGLWAVGAKHLEQPDPSVWVRFVDLEGSSCDQAVPDNVTSGRATTIAGAPGAVIVGVGPAATGPGNLMRYDLETCGECICDPTNFGFNGGQNSLGAQPTAMSVAIGRDSSSLNVGGTATISGGQTRAFVQIQPLDDFSLDPPGFSWEPPKGEARSISAIADDGTGTSYFALLEDRGAGGTTTMLGRVACGVDCLVDSGLATVHGLVADPSNVYASGVDADGQGKVIRLPVDDFPP